MMPPTDLAERLEARAERGAPRGAATVLAAARAEAVAPAPAGVARPPRHLLRIAAAVAVVAAVGAGVATLSRRSAPPAADGDAWCQALAAPATETTAIGGDLAVYVAPSPTVTTDLAALADRLAADPRVERVRVADQQDAFERFEVLFEGEEAILENVEPSDLPPWVEVDLVDPALTDAVVDELRSEPDVFEVRAQIADVRVLDLLVWPGARADIWERPGDPELGSALYPASWDELAEEAADSAPPELAGAVQTLLDRIEDPGYPLELSEDAGDPTFAATVTAARDVRAAASERCGLEVPERFTPAGAPTTATTQATSGD